METKSRSKINFKIKQISPNPKKKIPVLSNKFTHKGGSYETRFSLTYCAHFSCETGKDHNRRSVDTHTGKGIVS